MKSTLSTTLSLLLSTLFLLFLAAGCSQEQLASIDHAIADVNQVGQAAAQIATGPAAPLIPDPGRIILGLVTLGATITYGAWQKIRASKLLERKQDLGITLKAIVDAVQEAGDQADPVKSQVKMIMQDREIYSKANAIVDEYKRLTPPDLA